MPSFKDKVIIVTGASSGIGAGTAVHLARLGGLLTIVGRNVEKLKVTAEEIVAAGGAPALLIAADMNKESDVDQIFSATLAKHGRLDVLVNNAGILETGTIENTSLEQYDRLMNTNVRAIYHLTMLATPELIKTKGNIVNVSSVNGIRSFPGVLAYNVSKAAVDQFTRCVALELAPKGVRVNSVNPGVIITELQRRGGLDEEAYAKFLEHAKVTHALGRPGQVSEVAAAIAFLASDEASFSTGVSLPVDGGRHAMCPR
ncbi:cyclopentanol dehydrogenase-like [Drosophila guanche]|uniref:Blast:Cyclopentanol dehydrogenase n=1 Tax=Drosophila guanche TaxID=7266 RepID=A0A3B0JRW2_DROGU|nr:cyclopentanol dehydrogenase-like [Drosophila guanche]SPP83132.1 blast:Cyclopentanol dehydrogenase [Drosophila guanche]